MRRGRRTVAALVLAGVGIAGASRSLPAAGRDVLGPAPQSLVLVVVDTLRADHLGCYGYARPTSPFLDRLAAGGVEFLHAYAQASWTKPATASLLTGLYPTEHGASELGRLRPEVETLASVLRRRGYRTMGVVANGFLSKTFGFDRGFDDYVELWTGQGKGNADPSWEDALATVSGWPHERFTEPFFLFVFLIDPHTPYAPKPPYRDLFLTDPARVAVGLGSVGTVAGLEKAGKAALAPASLGDLIALYDAEIRYTDDGLRAFVDLLERRGVAGRTLVAVTADHGEGLFDHATLTHGDELYREQVHIPLVLAHPRLPAGRKVRAIAQGIDLVPTVLDLLHVGWTGGEGRSLVPLIDDDAPDGGEAYLQEKKGRVDLVSLVSGHRQLIHDRARDRWELYDLEADVREAHDLWAPGRSPELEQRLRAYLDRLPQPAESAGPAPAPDEERTRNLRALGYVQ